MPLGERGNVPIMAMDADKELPPAPLPFYGILHTPTSAPYNTHTTSSNNNVDVVKQYEDVLASTALLNTSSSTPVPYSKPVNPLAKRTSVVNNRRASGEDMSNMLPPPAPTVTLEDGTSLKTIAGAASPISDNNIDSPSTAAAQNRRQSAALADLLDMNKVDDKKSPFDD
jgi:hypothetical protein